jgi:hypothetical protein
VFSTLDAAALGLGERGMRTPELRPDDDEPAARDPASMTRPARTTPSMMVPGETASMLREQAERTSRARGAAAMGRAGRRDIDLLGSGDRTADDERRCRAQEQHRRHAPCSA